MVNTYQTTIIMDYVGAYISLDVCNKLKLSYYYLVHDVQRMVVCSFY